MIDAQPERDADDAPHLPSLPDRDGTGGIAMGPFFTKKGPLPGLWKTLSR
jgi:hypothetical protein